MKAKYSRFLSDESRKEFGILLLLDQLMRYDLLQTEKEDLEETIIKLEEIVAELKKGFFHTEEQEQELNDQKVDLVHAKGALTQIEKEMGDNEKFRISIALVEKDEERLEPFLKFMEERNILTVGKDNYYIPTERGREFYCQLVDQLESYVNHFEIFAYVDLENGKFGDPNLDLLEGNQWADLRVAVAEFKGIDPFKIVFLAMMSEDRFCENTDWKFELDLGSIFDDLEKIVQDQVGIEDLSYEDEEGFVSGEDVIKDIVSEGELRLKDKMLMKINKDKSLKIEEFPDEQVITKNYYW